MICITKIQAVAFVQVYIQTTKFAYICRFSPMRKSPSDSSSEAEESSQLSSSSSEDENEDEMPQKSPRAKRKPHFIFSFLDKVDDDFSCRYCDLSWKDERPEKKFPTGNVRKHFERKHLDILQSSGYLMSKIVAHPIQYSSELLNYDVMQWIAVKCLPLSTVDDELFRKIIGRTGFSLLKRKQLVDVYLPKVYSFYINNMKSLIENKTFYYSITSDGWSTSLNKKIHWCSTTIHFIDEDWNIRRRLLDIGDLGTTATASVITRVA